MTDHDLAAAGAMVRMAKVIPYDRCAGMLCGIRIFMKM